MKDVHYDSKTKRVEFFLDGGSYQSLPVADVNKSDLRGVDELSYDDKLPDSLKRDCQAKVTTKLPGGHYRLMPQGHERYQAKKARNERVPLPAPVKKVSK